MKTFRCGRCLADVDVDKGCDDRHPSICDDCWVELHPRDVCTHRDYRPALDALISLGIIEVTT